MICPSKISDGQLAKFTDEELADLYMQETMRWKDKVGRIWMVFRRRAEIVELDKKIILKPTSVDLVNIQTEALSNVSIQVIAQRIRAHELTRYEFVNTAAPINK